MERTAAGASNERLLVETERITPETAVVIVDGQADLHTAGELREKLVEVIEDGAHNVIVDLTRATFIDSMTLGVLLGAVKRLRPRGGQLKVIVDHPNIRRIFEITLLDRVFVLCESRADALDRLAT